ncbi:MAG: carbonic anhydrase [Candidatus Lariskella arthropodorum]
MRRSFREVLSGYHAFREKYVLNDSIVMRQLSQYGQKPDVMVVSCCDARVDPALILQCDPGELFVVRNVANIVPHYEKDEAHHGTSAALEFGICFLEVGHLILLGHSKCGGIQALLSSAYKNTNDFITNWVSIIKPEDECIIHSTDDYAKLALHKSYSNCLTFPWIREQVVNQRLSIHLWFFDIEKGEILTYSEKTKSYIPLIYYIDSFS